MELSYEVWTLGTVLGGDAAYTCTIAILILLVRISKFLHWYLLPVADVCERQHRPGKTLPIYVFSSKSNAEVANARIAEVLAASLEAYVPACSASIVLSLTWIALVIQFASSVFKNVPSSQVTLA
jgi:hypothetical protein